MVTPMQGADLNVSERYSNFHTIDWLRDLTKDRLRHRWILKEKAKGHLFEKIQAVFDACSGWFCVLLIGIAAGNITMQLRAHTKTKVTKKSFAFALQVSSLVLLTLEAVSPVA